MNKAEFKKHQPIVYRTLSNALKKHQLAHAYLFYGPKGSAKIDAAILLAQSIVCKHTDEDGFACQECETCKRIENFESIDFHFIGKANEKIKKKDIIDLQKALETTAAEAENKQTYILNGFDQATVESSNSLLKFLEEPTEGIVGILIADEKSKVLPTIQSRCQGISFRPASVIEMKQLYEQKVSSVEADMLARNGYLPAQVDEILEDADTWNLIRQESLEYTKHWQNHDAIVRMQTKVFPAKSKTTTKQWVRIWMEWILYWMRTSQIEMTFLQKVEIQNIIIESQDMLFRPVDLNLFLDRVYDRIRKAVKE